METLKNHLGAPILITNTELLHILSEKCSKRQAEQEAVEQEQEDNNSASDQTRQKPKQRRDRFQHRDYIEESTLAYLESTRCSQDLKALPTLVETLKGNAEDGGFGLTDGETLQMLNTMPTESVELHLIVEDLQSRLSEERRNELLVIVSQYAKPPEEHQFEEEETDEFYESGEYDEVADT